jgi:pimeloyl-ACP methyl ester carboxylesterase
MDYWDPTVTDGLARDREVILFDNAGVSSSSGEVPTTFEQMGANAVAFSRALGLNKADMLGFSVGGMVAQEIALQAPDLVRKLILVGTGPRGGEGMAINSIGIRFSLTSARSHAHGRGGRFGIKLVRRMAARESFAVFCTAPSGGGSNDSPIVNPSLSSNSRTSLK